MTHKLTIIQLFLFVLCISGCATEANSRYQIVTIWTTTEVDKSTICNLKNEEGEWKTLANSQLSILRDGNPMDVSCENTSNNSKTTVKPRFDSRGLMLDFMWDFCTLSCLIDSYTNAFYIYPSNIYVPTEKEIN